MTVLEVEDLRVTFRRRGAPPLRAVDGVSLTLSSGRTVALVGQSGSGKSTVVRALAGLQRSHGGRIALDDWPVRTTRRSLRGYRERVQMIFQDPFASLNPAHTVRYHLARPLHRHGGAAGGVEPALEGLLESVSLTPADQIAAKRPHELSGGQRQRVAIARALAPQPQVLLADEPVSMLDASVKLEILELLADVQRSRQLAMLYVTHDLATARYFSSEILVMYRGQIVERGPSDVVLTRPSHPYTQLLAGATPDPSRTKAQRLAEIRGRRVEEHEPTASETDATVRDVGGCPFRTACPKVMDVCVTSPPEVDVGPGHLAKCWLYRESSSADQRGTAR